jgi:hypothetical protein
MFLHKSVWHGSLTVPFEPFRFWLHIRGDIRFWKWLPATNDTGSRRLCVSVIRESPTAIELFKRKPSVLVIRRVDDSPHRWVRESTTPRVGDTGVDNSAYQWYGESPTLRIGESGSRYLNTFWKTPPITDTRSHRLPASLIRRVVNSPHKW